jgi:hypothetical protein
MRSYHSPVQYPILEPTNILMLGDWGTVSQPDQQIAVATAMKRWCDDYRIRPDALLMLGDNFYGEMPDGVNSHRWIKQFEQMYPSFAFPGPVYPVLGNHDYERFRGNKVEAELAYTGRSSRWTMPHRWYTVQIPKQEPLLILICLDSNLPGNKGLDPWPVEFSDDETATGGTAKVVRRAANATARNALSCSCRPSSDL